MRPVLPLVFLVMTAVFAIIGGGLVFTSVKAHWAALCSRCGYDLRGHHEQSRCPECGESFESMPEGFIERHHGRFILGLLLLCMAIGAFCLMFMVMIS